MNLTIYFLRHGETLASASGTYSGSLDIPLTPEGYAMAQDFASVYETLAWDAIYTSPLTRTKTTAQPLCEAVGMVSQEREGLREIAYGQWEGKTPKEVNEQFHDEYIEWLADPGWNAPTGGEKGIEIARRSSEVLEEIENKHPHSRVLVVSHKATIRIMLCGLLGIDIGRFRDRLGIPVASLSIVEMTKHGPLVKVMGDRSHLRPLLRQREGN